MTRSDARFVTLLLVIAGTLGGFAGSAITHLFMSESATAERAHLKHAYLEAEAAANKCHDDVAQLEQRVDEIQTAPPVVIAPATPPPDCDEVSCVLDNYQAACCARFRHGTPPDGIPDGLDRAMIQQAVSVVKPQILACGATSSARGRVRAHVGVAPDGKLTTVQINDSPDAALGECVKRGLEHLTFPKTHNGGTFGYPFVF